MSDLVMICAGYGNAVKDAEEAFDQFCLDVLKEMEKEQNFIARLADEVSKIPGKTL